MNGADSDLFPQAAFAPMDPDTIFELVKLDLAEEFSYNLVN